MGGRIIRRPLAVADAEECAVYLGRDTPDVAFRFLNALEQTISMLAEFSGIGRNREFRNPAHAGLCSFAVTGFRNHLIFFRPLEDGIEVVRVLHGARDLDGLFDGDSE